VTAFAYDQDRRERRVGKRGVNMPWRRLNLKAITKFAHTTQKLKHMGQVIQQAATMYCRWKPAAGGSQTPRGIWL